MKIVDLFCGCGGLSKGLGDAGFDVVWACDNWEKAVEVYRDNFDHPVEQKDLSDPSDLIGKIEGFEVSGIVGGPPCQDFSSAGKREEGGRADLTGSFSEIIQRVSPHFFIMENVPRARLSNAYASARANFKSAGYGLTEVVLDASLCGVPQKRKRFFCIGIKNAEDGALSDIIENKLSDEPMSVRNYLANEIDFEFYYRHPRNYSRRAIYSVDEPAATVRGVNRPVPAGYPGHKNDAVALDSSIRSLTTFERARIQTFPPKFKWEAAKTHLELMIGNAVPVELAKFVGECVFEGLKSADAASGQRAEEECETC